MDELQSRTRSADGETLVGGRVVYDDRDRERAARLISDAAEAQEIFGDDELERHAEELRRRGEL